MALSQRQKYSAWVLFGAIGAWFLDPIITIFRLNVENWAAENKIDRLLVEDSPESSERLMSYVAQGIAGAVGLTADAIGFIASPVGLAFVLGALFIGFAPYISRLPAYIGTGHRWLRSRAKEALSETGVSSNGSRPVKDSKAPNSHPTQDHDLIPMGISLVGQRHRDGVDLSLMITLRNRSASKLVIDYKGRG